MQAQTLKIYPSCLKGDLLLPPSKSQSLRAILFATLARGKSCIRNSLVADDSEAMLAACAELGAQIERSPDGLHILGLGGRFPSTAKTIHAGNSGIVLRFLTAIAALSSNPVQITGDPALCQQRRVDALIQALEIKGATNQYHKQPGYAPLSINGPLQPGPCTINGEDSQPVSALFIACALTPGKHEIIVKNSGEKPWLELTRSWLDAHGCPVQSFGDDRYAIEGGWVPEAFDYTVPGDLSSLAFPVAATLIAGDSLRVHGVDLGDLQGDKRFLSIVSDMGASFSYDATKQCLSIAGPSQLRGQTIDINDCIDTLPVLAALACYAKGVTRITNAKVARGKECDRIHAMALELNHMGARVIEHEDGLEIHGGLPLTGATLHSHNDHRTAMALSVAALGAKGASTINPSNCISKTYRNFSADLSSIGAKIEEEL